MTLVFKSLLKDTAGLHFRMVMFITILSIFFLNCYYVYVRVETCLLTTVLGLVPLECPRGPVVAFSALGHFTGQHKVYDKTPWHGQPFSC